MKIAENVYQVSGNIYGMNSNIFVLESEEELTLIDAGNTKRQYEQTLTALKAWGLENKPIRHVLITHAHMDHIGGAHLYEEQGARICIGAEEGSVAEQGGPSVLEDLFQSRYIPCRSVTRLQDGEIITCGQWKIQTLFLPGHTKGTAAYLADDGRKKIFFAGDLFLLSGVTPADQPLFELGWNGSPDYDREKNKASFSRLRGLKVDLVAPGHGGVYNGESTAMFEQLYAMAMEE